MGNFFPPFHSQGEENRAVFNQATTQYTACSRRKCWHHTHSQKMAHSAGKHDAINVVKTTNKERERGGMLFSKA